MQEEGKQRIPFVKWEEPVWNDYPTSTGDDD